MTKQKDSNDIEANSEQPLDQQWQEIAQDWQQQEYKKTDIKALTKQTAARIFKAKLLFAFDLIATLFIVVYFAFNFNNFEDKASFYYMAFAAIGTPIYMFYAIKIRRASWQLGQGTPSSALFAALAACRSSINYLQLLKFSSYIMFVAVNWYIYELGKTSEKSIWLAILLANIPIFLIYYISHRMQNKRLIELTKLQQLHDENKQE